jgi:hypothetical protein
MLNKPYTLFYIGILQINKYSKIMILHDTIYYRSCIICIYHYMILCTMTSLIVKFEKTSGMVNYYVLILIIVRAEVEVSDALLCTTSIPV